MQQLNHNTITVYDKQGRLQHPCSGKKAWVLVSRQRAEYIDDTKSSIRILVSIYDIRKLKKEVINKANRICYICGYHIPESESATVDHKIPKAIRNKQPIGLDTEDNMYCCCRTCNNHKDMMSLDEYIMFRTAILLSYLSVITKSDINQCVRYLRSLPIGGE